MTKAAAGPSDRETATARLSSMTGDGVSRPSASYSVTIRAQSVSAAAKARA
jgi:hypothetical protein